MVHRLAGRSRLDVAVNLAAAFDLDPAVADRARDPARQQELSSIPPDELCCIGNLAPNVSRKLVLEPAVDLGFFS